jgi:hypothetical protein
MMRSQRRHKPLSVCIIWAAAPDTRLP